MDVAVSSARIRFEEAVMSLNTVKREKAVAVSILWDAPERSGSGSLTRKQAVNALTLLVMLALFGLLLISNTKPVQSQGVQLVKVDVAVVAQGYRLSTLVGTDVTNDKNEKIGSLDDIIVDRSRALFAVLQVGGFLGIGGRLVAVPYEALVIDESGKKIQLPGASKEQLQKLAEFKYRT
jgi:hypothetical protein